MYDEHTRQALHAEWDHCINSNRNEPEPEPFHKVNPPDDCAMSLAGLMAAGKGVWLRNLHGPVGTSSLEELLFPGHIYLTFVSNSNRTRTTSRRGTATLSSSVEIAVLKTSIMTQE